MAKLPDFTELGPNPDLRSGRPIASIDASPIGKGVAALGQGVADLGAGIGAYGQAQDRYDLAKRNSQFETERIKLDSEFDRDTDFATREARYKDKLDQLRADVLKDASPRVSETLTVRTDPVIAKSVDRQKDVAYKQETDYKLADAKQRGGQMIDAAVGSDDREARTRIIDAHNDMIDALVGEGRMTAQQGLAEKQQWAQHYALADGVARADRDPETVINDLRAKPGSMGEIANRVIQVESGGDPRARASTSSAYGAAQFLRTSKGDQTWYNLVKEFRPDLAEGKTVAEIDEMRADPNLSKEMLLHLLDKNKAILSRNGIEATPGALYLSHFLGPRSAVAVSQADPGRPVLDVFKDAVGEKMASAMVEANPSILKGVQAGTVVEWADRKMGGADRASVYGLLRPEQRAALLVHAQNEAQKRRVDDGADFKRRVEDTLTEAGRTGGVSNPIGQWEFIARLGYEQGNRAFKSYSDDIQLGKDAGALANMSPEQQRNLLDSYTPQPGTEGYAEQNKRQELLLKALQRVEKDRGDDPAKFAQERLPAVRAAKGALDLMIQDPQASPDDKVAAARKYADVMLFEQQRVGVPAQDRRLVSKAYVDDFTARLNNPKAAGGAVDLAKTIEAEASLWGDHWPLVYKDLAKKAGPLAIVIGSGVKPAAAQILTEFAQTKMAEIANDQDETRIKAIVDDVRKEFRPLSATFTGNEGAQPVVDAFQHAGEKLAAFYVRGGMTSSDAAKKAFDDLLGHKYDFVGDAGLFSTSWTSGDRYRVPKAPHPLAPQAPLDDIKRGAERAKADLASEVWASPTDRMLTLASRGAGPLVPIARAAQVVKGMAESRDLQNPYDLAPLQAVPGVGSDFALRETLARYQRDGVWVTALGDTGLMLVYGDQAVRTRAGGALILTWAQLAELARNRPRPAMPGGGGGQ